MNAVEALLIAFDEAWKYDYESLNHACKDLTEEQAVWQPPSYKREAHDDGVGRPGTILWHLNHLEGCHRYYLSTLANLSSTESPETELPGELGLKKALSALGDATLNLRNAVAELQPEDLKKQARPNMNVAQFIAMFTRHMVWHAAYIKQTRRLWRHR